MYSIVDERIHVNFRMVHNRFQDVDLFDGYGSMMKHPKYQVFLNDSEYSALLCSLIELKNSLIEQGRYTDVIDEILIKLSKSKRKKRRL